MLNKRILTAGTACLVLFSHAGIGASIGSQTLLETRVHDVLAGVTQFIPAQVGIESSQTKSFVSTRLSDNQPHIMSRAWAYANQHGTLRARATSQSSNPGFIRYQTVRDEATATWSETINITGALNPQTGVPVAVGTLASVPLYYDFHGGFLGDDNGTSDISRYNASGSILLRSTVDNNFQPLNSIEQSHYNAGFDHVRRLQNLGLKVAHNDPLGTAGATAQSLIGMGYGFSETLENRFFFQVGLPVTVSIRLVVKGFSFAQENGDFASMIADGGNTASWGGFGDIQLSDGTIISEFTAIGEGSGIDFRHAIAPAPVPLPASWLLFLGAMVVVRKYTMSHAITRLLSARLDGSFRNLSGTLLLLNQQLRNRIGSICGCAF